MESDAKYNTVGFKDEASRKARNLRISLNQDSLDQISSILPSTTNNSEWRARYSALNKVRVNSRQKYNDELIRDYENEFTKKI
jgi:hypothetical protein